MQDHNFNDMVREDLRYDLLKYKTMIDRGWIGSGQDLVEKWIRDVIMNKSHDLSRMNLLVNKVDWDLLLKELLEG